MSGVLLLWNEWEVQILVLASFALQVLLLFFGRMRRRNISRTLRFLLWLMYLLADSTAIYTLGHMSINCTPDRHHHRQLMAFWAPFLLVHLGGQDTITAYAMEDNQLWLRHLLTFAVQAVGAAYVVYKNMDRRQEPLAIAAVLMFVVGFLKNGERVFALSSSSLESIRKLLDNVDIKEKNGNYFARGHALDDEVVLHGAHDLIYTCMGQFVDDKVWPNAFQMDAIKFFHEMDSTCELIEMQLSLMYDIFYTKAAVIYTMYGCSIRAVSLLSTVVALFLFHFFTVKDAYNKFDVFVTYILLVGASLLEIASVFRAMGSTWTCAVLKAQGWDWLHWILVSLRRCFRVPKTKRWPGSLGQHNLVDSCAEDTRSARDILIYLWKDSSIGVVSIKTKKLVLEEISRMVQACEGQENVLRSYRGQSSLKRHDGLLEDLNWSPDMEFDERILAWHLATDRLLKKCNFKDAGPLVEATKALSNYMMFLFVERPYMLPSPVRPRLYVKAREYIKKWEDLFEDCDYYIRQFEIDQATVVPGVTLANKLIDKTDTVPNLLHVVFGVWVEMLCYAAHHCSRDSHARQLNNGGEFITIAWLLTTFEFDRCYWREVEFKERKRYRFPWHILLEYLDNTKKSCWAFLRVTCWIILEPFRLVLKVLCLCLLAPCACLPVRCVDRLCGHLTPESCRDLICLCITWVDREECWSVVL